VDVKDFTTLETLPALIQYYTSVHGIIILKQIKTHVTDLIYKQFGKTYYIIEKNLIYDKCKEG